MRQVEEYLRELDAVIDPAGATAVFRRHVDRLGVERFTYINTGAKFSPYHYETTYPLEWAQHYERSHYVDIDPVTTEGKRSVVAYQWTPLLERTGVTANQRRIFDEAAEFGIRDGLSVPIHGVGGDFAILSMASSRPDFITCRHGLHLMALYYHDRMESLRSEAARGRIRLSPRERECLSWVARGKTAWEISQILRIAETTVVYHVENAKAKLGVNTRNHAVVKAIMMGLITP